MLAKPINNVKALHIGAASTFKVNTMSFSVAFGIKLPVSHFSLLP